MIKSDFPVNSKIIYERKEFTISGNRSNFKSIVRGKPAIISLAVTHFFIINYADPEHAYYPHYAIHKNLYS